MEGKRFVYLLGILSGLMVFFLLLSGCAGFFEQYNVYATGGQVSDKYAWEKLEGKVCVMGTRVPTGSEGYRNTVSNLLTAVLKKHSGNPQKGFDLISHTDFMNEVNQKGLIDEYIKMTDVYNKTAIFPKESLRLFQEEMGIRYFIKPVLLQLQQRADSRLSGFGLRLIVTRETITNLTAEVWDADTGAKLWEGEAGCAVAGEKVSEKRISPEKVITDAWEELVKKLLDTVKKT